MPRGKSSSRGRGFWPWFNQYGKYILLAEVAIAAIGLVFIALGAAKPVTVNAEPRVIPTFGQAAEDPEAVTFIGDSYTRGSGMDSGGDALWPALLSSQLGYTPTNLAVGGVGYVQAGPNGETFVTEAEQVPASSDVVVMFGSRNDETGYNAVFAAAQETINKTKNAAPSAKMLMIGPAWVDTAPPAYVKASRDAVKDAAAAAGVEFVDPITEGWFTEGNAALIGADGVHPTDEGHVYLAGKMKPYLEAAIAD